MTDLVRRRAALAVVVVAMVLIVGGIGLVFVPAGMVAAGVAMFALLTFDPANARKLTWPR
jgi:hypothetical protein